MQVTRGVSQLENINISSLIVSIEQSSNSYESKLILHESYFLTFLNSNNEPQER